MATVENFMKVLGIAKFLLEKDPELISVNDIQYWPDDENLEISFNDWKFSFKVSIKDVDKDPVEFWEELERRNKEIEQERADKLARRRELAQDPIIKEWLALTDWE